MRTAHLRDWIYDRRPPDVIWLAGYPRSGITLARTIFAHCFGAMTASLYDESPMGFSHRYATGAAPPWLNSDGLRILSRRQGIMPIKTHERPEPIEPIRSLVIVRDGRRVMKSLHQFYADGDWADVSMADVIRGEHMWGSWSEWINAWSTAPSALFVHYEQMVNDLSGVVDILQHHFMVDPIGRQIPTFEELHKAQPQFFREGKTDPKGALSDEEEELFWELHEEAMTSLGYVR